MRCRVLDARAAVAGNVAGYSSSRWVSGEFPLPVSEPRDTRRATLLRVGAFGPLPALLERQGLAVDDDGLLAIAAEARIILGRLAALGVALA